MKIFIYTSNFLGTKPIIELIEFTFQYGSKKGDKPKILVKESDPEFCKAPSVDDDPFIFIFAGISLDQVKFGLKNLFDKYGNNERKNIFVITRTKEEDKKHNPEFLYDDLGLKSARDGFNISHFLVYETVNFEDNFSRALRQIIFQYNI